MNTDGTLERADGEPYIDDVSLVDVATVLLRRRRLMLISAFLGLLLGLVAALMTPLEYTATASFLPHGGDQGALSGVAGLASQFGFSVPGSSGVERSPTFYQDLLQSREILTGVIESGVEVITASGVTTVDLAEQFRIEIEQPEIRREVTRRILAEIISISLVRETGVVTVSVQTEDPGLSAAIVRRLLDEITEFDLETRRSEASAQRAFTQERLAQLHEELTVAEDSLELFLVENRQFSNSPQLTFGHDRLRRQVLMRQDLVTAMAKAYEEARISEVRNTAVITVIDQPEPPALPNPRGRLMKLFLYLTLGLLAGVVLVFTREFGERVTRDENEGISELRQVLSETKRDILGLRRSSASAPISADSDV